MFLKQLIRRNPEFVKTVVHLHQDGQIPANSYVLDLDTIEANARVIAAEGQRLGLKVYPMTKQIGRNPFAMRAMAKHELDAYVAVDMGCAWPIRAAGYEIGHLGHLVQIPQAETQAAAALKPYYWTVFNMEKAGAAAQAAGKVGRQQALLARIFAPGDVFYMGHEGGFESRDVLRVADEFDRLPNARFAGITTFPALLFDLESQQVKPTPNLGTLEKAAEALAAAGRAGIEINAPGTTSTAVMELLASAGATQVEPGHGLTGTTPLHAVRELPELPGVLYLTEISHHYNGKAYCFGGGLYIDPVFPDYDVKALVGKDPDTILSRLMPVQFPPPNAIDYYGIITPQGAAEVGDSVVFGFRIQAFVTRALVVPVSGISKSQPVVEGIFSADGKRTGWPAW
jgi:predicted amino acid racemase